jgi:Flp pilus assembly protein TadD
MDATEHYSTRHAARILNSTEAEVRRWARLGGVVTESGAGRPREFTFQELLLLRTTRGLLEAGIPPRRVRRIWASLRRQLTDDMPLTSIRVLANGDRVVASDGATPWQPDSGQLLLDFEASEVAVRAPAPTPAPAATLRTVAVQDSSLSAEQWFHLGCELEATSPVEARQAYLQALAADPDHANAHLNLGRLFHEAGELAKAEAYYQGAVRRAPDDATSHFNLGVLLEDRGRPDEAIHAYRQAIARDPDAADAHYNLGLLLEGRGRRAEAMKHLMIARDLYAQSGRGN